jgi:hypothetical protein
MEETRRWVIVVIAVLLVAGLLAFARGRDHHRGNDVGSDGALGASATVAAS